TVTAYLAERGLDVSGVDLSPRMIENARRLHPQCRFSVASATDLDLDEASHGGVLGWWSLFNLPRDVLPQVLAMFARALKPGGHCRHAGGRRAPPPPPPHTSATRTRCAPRPTEVYRFGGRHTNGGRNNSWT